MPEKIVYIDTEIDPRSGKILDMGAVREDGSFIHTANLKEFARFLENTEYICGHNLLQHDLVYLYETLVEYGVLTDTHGSEESLPRMIDTLPFSPLLFPEKPYHHLIKDDKIVSDELNNPRSDAEKAKELFEDELEAFDKLENGLRFIYYGLLYQQSGFCSFFKYWNNRHRMSKLPADETEPSSILPFPSFYEVREQIRSYFRNRICEQADLDELIAERPVELAYALALINSNQPDSITPRWVLKNYPVVEEVMFRLRNVPCGTPCNYCNNAWDIHTGLKKYFGYNVFREFDGKPLQEEAVRMAVENRSFLAIFPTGGGKSLTFQLPALMSGENTHGLTVIISPLQSLMKDQVDNLEKNHITYAVTINGLLEPIERAKAFERVEDGSALLLYISPESLRSPSIERLLLARKIVRFVIDEAHCFSAWGQDFRVDYLYIGDFIKRLQQQKQLSAPIPVSCFTATARKQVIADIRNYFTEKLGVLLEVIASDKISRNNLHYKVINTDDKKHKYKELRNLIETTDKPVIVYVSRTRHARELAIQLSKDGFAAACFHGKMDTKDKIRNQNSFMSGEVMVMVATSAFGMGIDKDNVGMVIHYDISDSLENYVQEAGRAGRDQQIEADCYVLFNEDDLNKHFILLNQTKLNIKEIQQVWKAIRSLTDTRSFCSQSALEIARKAGWDDQMYDIETRVTTAIAALEQAGFVSRGHNMPRVYANSILAKTAGEAIDKINASDRFDSEQKEKAIRIIKKLIAARSRHHNPDDAGESRVDYISDHLGIEKLEVIRIINLLREDKILSDSLDLTAYLNDNEQGVKNKLNYYYRLEQVLSKVLTGEVQRLHLKEILQEVEKLLYEQYPDTKIKESRVAPEEIRMILNFWSIKHFIKQERSYLSRYHFKIELQLIPETLQDEIENRHLLCRFITNELYRLSIAGRKENAERGSGLVEFSVNGILEKHQRGGELFRRQITLAEVEDALFFLSRMGVLKIEGGFLVSYNQLTLERKVMDNKTRYKTDDYRKLGLYYENKIHQIHIVGEYARKMVGNYSDALQFVDDYFKLDYTDFLRRYYPGSRKDELNRNLTPIQFQRLFGELSTEQLQIVNDRKTNYIVVAAGPGSGKTKLLVHKLAALVTMEDVKYEQLLMLTFSRAAAYEFRERLIGLIGQAARNIEIKTFHAWCFDLLGRMGDLESAGEIIKEATELILSGKAEPGRITKTVLVIDEAQDINQQEFDLINALIDRNEEMRIIAVGDDDQNIFSFRGSSPAYMTQMISEWNAVKYELPVNYRSRKNLVEFTDTFIRRLPFRLKEVPAMAKNNRCGDIGLFQYESQQIMTSFVEWIAGRQTEGETAVLTRTNDEAVQINGMLLKKGIPARLIQTNSGFRWDRLDEVHTFLEMISESEEGAIIRPERWEESRERLRRRFDGSEQLENVCRMIEQFEHLYPRIRYRNDLQLFVNESSAEDFFRPSSREITVSTIHKAKGKEFDTVFVLLQAPQGINTIENTAALVDEEEIRKLYVAMTRARNNLFIHCNLKNIRFPQVDGSVYQFVEGISHEPEILLYPMSHEDVYLSFFLRVQKQLDQLKSGDPLFPVDAGCNNKYGVNILRFSAGFQNKLQRFNQMGFVPASAKVAFVVWWYQESNGKEIKIVLPEITFKRMPDGIHPKILNS